MPRLVRQLLLCCWLLALVAVVRHLHTPAIPGDAMGIVLQGAAVATRALAAYLLLATGTDVAAGVTRSTLLERASARVTPRTVHWLVCAALAAASVTSSVTPATADSTAVVHVIVSDTPTSPPPQSRRPPGTRHANPAPHTKQWTVRAGDHFWSIAQRTAGRGEDVEEVWRWLIERNRERLLDPANPDLLVPGQVLVISRTPTTRLEVPWRISDKG